MSTTATFPESDTRAVGATTNVSASGNPALAGWHESVVYPWHRHYAVDPGGNEAGEGDEKAWARVARRARTSWMRDNPY